MTQDETVKIQFLELDTAYMTYVHLGKISLLLTNHPYQYKYPF